MRVENGGTEPLDDIRIEVFPCDYTVGPLPAGMLVRGGAFTGRDRHVLEPGQKRVIRSDGVWVPTAQQVSLNKGHLCLAVNCFASNPDDGTELLPGTPILPLCDSHHGQRNIALVAAPPGTIVPHNVALWGMAEGIDQPPVEEIQIKTEPKTKPPTDPGEEFGPGDLDLINSGPFGPDFTDFTVSRSIREPIYETLAMNVPDVGRGRELRVEVSPEEPRIGVLEIEVGADEVPGSVQIYDTIGRDPRTGSVLGGARMLVMAI